MCSEKRKIFRWSWAGRFSSFCAGRICLETRWSYCGNGFS
jgi:hypothetical protein